jgi:hypothetical protein
MCQFERRERVLIWGNLGDYFSTVNSGRACFTGFCAKNTINLINYSEHYSKMLFQLTFEYVGLMIVSVNNKGVFR